MKKGKKKIFTEQAKSELFQRLDEISVNPDGSPRSEARKLIAILETERDLFGENARVFGKVFDLAQEALCKTDSEKEWLSDVVTMALCLGNESRGSKVELASQFISEIGALGARSRHRETDEMKAAVFIWLDENRGKYKSMKEAAGAIIRNEPISFMTAQEWGAAWKKERSSARQDSKKPHK